MKIKQFSALLLALSVAFVQSIYSMEDEVVVKGFNEPQCDAAGAPKKTVAKKQRKDKAKSVKAKKGPAKKKAKKAKGKRRPVKGAKKPKKDMAIAKIGKFDANGNIKSFLKASNGLIEFMNENSKKATAAQKMELFTIIARFNWITGRKGFDTPSHYAATKNILEAASKNKGLFGPVKIKFINKWMGTKEAQISDPIKNIKVKDVKTKAPLRRKVKKDEVKKSANKKNAVIRKQQVRKPVK